ncbi:hypothetical protein SISNIDRAFT_542813 [Sistotremastrum niveocremeum HHB9708]|uniref:Cupredoxin n=1 Tax=Sistotremastrum niveocremeum HHB9708 TaxID=1314777 RepID=A0A164MEH7_9AGAM|nr:hypothetical protein SISNIDRAFT_542813 [Sistotremastrum niveocremeum HHB9708]
MSLQTSAMNFASRSMSRIIRIVTQSSFSEPCAPLTNLYGTHIGFDSGFMPVTSGSSNPPTFSVIVNDTKPIWGYCRQTASPKTHCQQDMVFAVNAPQDPSPNTFPAFQKLAAASTSQDTTSASPSQTSSESSSSTFTSAAATSTVTDTGVTHFVSVGGVNSDGTPKLMFDPNNIVAQPGDKVMFQFNVKNHTATQSAFQEPCAPLSDQFGQHIGFDSGFMPFNPNVTSVMPTFTIRVNDTKPIWGYCRQVASPKTHCESGMVFAINAPSDPAPNTFTAYQKLALASTIQDNTAIPLSLLNVTTTALWASSSTPANKNFAVLGSSSDGSDEEGGLTNVLHLLSALLGLVGFLVAFVVVAAAVGIFLLIKTRKSRSRKGSRMVDASYRPVALPKSKMNEDGTHDYDAPLYADGA